MLFPSLRQHLNEVVYVKYKAGSGYFELAGRLIHVCESCFHIQYIESDGELNGLHIVPSDLLISMVVGHIDEKRLNLEACFKKEFDHANSIDR